MADYREISLAGDDRGSRKAAPRRRPVPPRAPIPAVDWRALSSGFAGYCRARPATVLSTLAALGAVTVVCLNALGSQNGRHPAPILPKVAIRQDAAPSRETRAPADKPAEEVRAAARAPEPALAGPAAAKPAAKPARDPIAALIRQEAQKETRQEETTASVTPKAEKAEASDKAVLQAQRALNKLGYGPLKADGLMGPGTRAALEKFERDRKLPVKGEAAGRTLKELAARAGARQG